MALDNKHIGIQIKKVRGKRNISQEQLAELTGICVASLSLIENGKRQARLDTIISIANVLNVNIEELLTFHLEIRNGRNDEIESLLDGCSLEERQIIIKTATILKEALKAIEENRL